MKIYNCIISNEYDTYVYPFKTRQSAIQKFNEEVGSFIMFLLESCEEDEDYEGPIKVNMNEVNRIFQNSYLGNELYPSINIDDYTFYVEESELKE